MKKVKFVDVSKKKVSFSLQISTLLGHENIFTNHRHRINLKLQKDVLLLLQIGYFHTRPLVLLENRKFIWKIKQMVISALLLVNYGF